MKNRYWARSLVLIFAFCLTTLSAIAQGERQPTIDVQASADVKVVPDEVFIGFGVETSDPSLSAAKTQNDERVKRLLALTKEMSIDPKYVQTDFISMFTSSAQAGGGVQNTCSLTPVALLSALFDTTLTDFAESVRELHLSFPKTG